MERPFKVGDRVYRDSESEEGVRYVGTVTYAFAETPVAMGYVEVRLDEPRCVMNYYPGQIHHLGVTDEQWQAVKDGLLRIVS